VALERIHLRKLLKVLFLDSKKQRSAIRKDIWEDRVKEAGRESSGGDFYGPFWADAKSHVFGTADLHTLVDQRVASNLRRGNLYPRLRDGFLVWWNERRRWTNEPFRPGESPKARFEFRAVGAVVKVDNILSVRDGLRVERLVYPYFAPEPVLSEHAARLGLWLLVTALPTVPPSAIRILDVIAGRTFSLDRTPLLGNEEQELRRLYLDLLRRRDELRDEEE
jgi:hypothetical protein